MEEFNKEFGHTIVWAPWQRPGFELAMMLRRAIEENPGCDGIVLGGHGLFTWGNTQRESYLNTITITRPDRPVHRTLLCNEGRPLHSAARFHENA